MTTNELIAALVHADPTGQRLVMAQTGEDDGDQVAEIKDLEISADDWDKINGYSAVFLNWFEEQEPE